ncbi:hypothetical protein F4776DRAFT_601969, partial [Hypoxylon sp. NC0597]
MDYTEQLIWSCYGMMDLELKVDDHKYEEQSIDDDEDEAQPLQNFVIAISGCSSAGKTTLALLLDVVLQKALRCMVSNNKEDPFELPLQTAVIHEDAYFFKSPTATPTPTPMVAIQPLWPEDRLVAHMTGPSDAPILVEDRDRVGTCDIELLATHIDEPDAERRSVVPNPRFLENLYQGQKGGSLPAMEAALDELSAGTLDAAVSVLRNTMRDILGRDEEELDLARAHIRFDDDVPLVARRFTVVEGFTLLARDQDQDPIGWVPPGSEVRALRDLRRIQDRLDISLFLPVERSEARNRRFERARYKDVPEGTRKPGQYWKCHAYFDQVAWPHYERYHRHILSNLSAAYTNDDQLRQQQQHGRPWCATNTWERDPRVCGVHVRPATVRSVDDTLLWAVSVVGAALAERLLQDSDLDLKN